MKASPQSLSRILRYIEEEERAPAALVIRTVFAQYVLPFARPEEYYQAYTYLLTTIREGGKEPIEGLLDSGERVEFDASEVTRFSAVLFPWNALR